MSVVPESEEIVAGVRAGERAMLSRAITMLESGRPEHRVQARRLLEALGPGPQGTVRIGVSGVPGVGKSTFIESFGLWLIGQGHKVGVLAKDHGPGSSHLAALAQHPDAFVRTAPAAGVAGGVIRATAQSVPLLEAAGCDVVLVETDGDGEDEATVRGIVDTFVLLGLARSGEQLQGVTRGTLDLVDVIVMNKADSGFEREARTSAKELAAALRLVFRGSRWMPPVLTASGLQRTGMDDLWEAVYRHRKVTGDRQIAQHRAEQQWALAQTLVREELEERLHRSRGVRAVQGDVRAHVLNGDVGAVAAADALLSAFDRG